MSDALLVALITLVGTVTAAVVSSLATVRAANLEATRSPNRERAAAARVLVSYGRRRALKTSVVVALVIGLAMGLAGAVLSTSLKREVLARVRGDLAVLEVLKSYSIKQFSNPTNIGHWQPAPGTAPAQFVAQQAPGRGEDGALAIQSTFTPNSDSDLAVARIVEEDLPSKPATLIVAWVFVESSEGARLAGLTTRLDALLTNGDGTQVITRSLPVRLQPGKWTPIVWSGPEDIHFWAVGTTREMGKENCRFATAGARMTAVDVLVWASARPFSGTIFLDDVSFYAHRSSDAA